MTQRDEEKQKELDHIIQTGHDRINEFDHKGSEILKKIEQKTDEMLEKMFVETKKIHEEKAEKAWNFIRWFVGLTVGGLFLLSGSNRLMVEKKMDKFEIEIRYMTKENAKKIYRMQDYKFNALMKGDTAAFDETNYNWLIESLFDENSRGIIE